MMSSRSSLSKLYRYTVLARALKLSIKDLISLKTLTGKEPFQKDPSQPGLPADTIVSWT